MADGRQYWVATFDQRDYLPARSEQGAKWQIDKLREHTLAHPRLLMKGVLPLDLCCGNEFVLMFVADYLCRILGLAIP